MQKKGIKIEMGLAQDLVKSAQKLQSELTSLESELDNLKQKAIALNKKFDEPIAIWAKMSDQAKELGFDINQSQGKSVMNQIEAMADNALKISQKLK